MDFSIPANPILTFGSTAVLGSTACVTVSITNDDRVEDTETFSAVLSPGSEQPVMIGSPDSVTVEIPQDPADSKICTVN